MTCGKFFPGHKINNNSYEVVGQRAKMHKARGLTMAKSDKGSAGGGNGGGSLALTGITPDSGLIEGGDEVCLRLPTEGWNDVRVSHVPRPRPRPRPEESATERGSLHQNGID